MSNNRFQYFFVALISVYSGLIATNCICRIMLSLARHGLMSWRELLYDFKIILIVAIYIAYREFRKSLYIKEGNFYKDLAVNNLLLLFGVVVGTRLVFSQFSSFYEIFVRPFVWLFLKW